MLSTDKPMGATGRRKSPAKTQKILEGAMKEFLSAGYGGASMDNIAALSGVSKATVYSHFNDKENLFRALIEHLAHQKLGTLSDENINETFIGNPEEVVKHFAKTLLKNSENSEFLDFMRLIIGESGRFPALAQTVVKSLHQPVIEALTQYFKTNTNLVDPEISARIILDSLVHFIIMNKMFGGEAILPVEQDRYIEGLVDLIVRSSQPTGLANK